MLVNRFFSVLDVIPLILCVTTISLIRAIFESHRFSTEILKLLETPLVASRQPANGMKMGANEQPGGDWTKIKNSTGMELIEVLLVVSIKSSTYKKYLLSCLFIRIKSET